MYHHFCATMMRCQGAMTSVVSISLAEDASQHRCATMTRLLQLTTAVANTRHAPDAHTLTRLNMTKLPLWMLVLPVSLLQAVQVASLVMSKTTPQIYWLF
jgi:hypothetical protein